MTELIRPTEVCQPPKSLPRRVFSPSSNSARLISVLLAAGYTAQVVFRLILSIGRFGPINIADEIGYLLNARLLAGGVPGQMNDTTFYRGGYSLFIAPAYLFTDNPRVSYNLILGINALISAAVFPLLYYLLTRIFSIRQYPALLLSFIAALYPPLVLNSLMAWSESLLYVLMLLITISLGKMVGSGTQAARWKWSLAAGVVTGFLYIAHGRMAPVVVLLVVAFAAIAVLRHDLRIPAVAAILATGVMLGLGELLNGYLVRNIWGESSGSEASRVLDNLGKSGIFHGAVASAAGQYWYLIAGTFGLFGVGIFALCRFLRMPSADSTQSGWQAKLRLRFQSETNGSAVVAAFLLLSTLGLMLLAAIFLFPPQRPDHLVYGRYCELVAPIVVALGLHRLWSRYPHLKLYRELAIIFSLLGISFLLFQHYHNDLVFGPIANSYTTLNLPWISRSMNHIRPQHVMLAAVLIMLVLLVFRFRRIRIVGVAAIATTLVVSSWSTAHKLFPGTQNNLYGADLGNVIPSEEIKEPQNIAYDNAYFSIESRFAFQWLLNDAHFVLFNSQHGDRPTTRYVISSVDWPQAKAQNAKLFWSERYGKIGLWEIPSNPIQALK